MSLQTAQAVNTDKLNVCYYAHLAIVSKGISGDDELRAFDGVRLPVYIGYLKIVESLVYKGNIKELSFVRKTDLPVNWVGRSIEEVARKRMIYLEDVHAPTKVYYGYKYFRGILSGKLSEMGVETVYSEDYTDFYFQHDFPPPVLNAEDFEYAETCVYRPTATPPAICEDLRGVELANKDALDTKIAAHYEIYDKRGRMKLFIRARPFFTPPDA